MTAKVLTVTILNIFLTGFYKGSDGGTGIGLSLAKEIIHLHKGNVTAYNYLDGAVFEVKLPIVD
mgnify:CR=1 FL=1